MEKVTLVSKWSRKMAPFEQKRPSTVEHRATNLVFFILLDTSSRTNYIVLERTILFFYTSKVTMEKRLSKAGVIRKMEKSAHCLWVSTPRVVRILWKVTATINGNAINDM
jgi:hypothetical protein